MVDSGAAPDLGVFTIAGAEHSHGHSHHVVTLVVEDHAALAVTFDLQIFGTLALWLCFGEDVVLDNHILVDVYGHVAVDMAALVAAAIDVTLKDASVIVFCGIVRSGTHKVIFIDIPDSCVPLQYLTLFGQLVYFVGGTKVNFF